MIIAIDGPAAAGKGTLASRLAQHFGLPYLDTGLLYRAVGRSMIDQRLDPADAAAAGKVARSLDAGMLAGPRPRRRRARCVAAAARSPPAPPPPGRPTSLSRSPPGRGGGRGGAPPSFSPR